MLGIYLLFSYPCSGLHSSIYSNVNFSCVVETNTKLAVNPTADPHHYFLTAMNSFSLFLSKRIFFQRGDIIRLLFLFVGIFCLVSPTFAQWKRLTSSSFYNLERASDGDRPIVPSDTVFYTYSGNRTGDYERGIYYDVATTSIFHLNDTPRVVRPLYRVARKYADISSQNIIHDTSYTWNESAAKWITQEIYERTFSASGKKLYEQRKQPIGFDSMRLYSRTNYTYNSNDSLILEVMETFDGLSWNPYNKVSIEYDSRGNIIRRITDEGYTSGSWKRFSKEISEYNAQNLLTRFEITGANSRKEIYTYDAKKRLANSWIQTQNNMFTINDTTEYRFSANDDTLTITVAKRDEQSMFYSRYIQNIEVYNSKGIITERIGFTYAPGSGLNLPSYRSRYSYNSSDLMVSDSTITITDGFPTLSYINRFRYDAQGRNVESEYLTPDSLGVFSMVTKTLVERTADGQLSRITNWRSNDTLRSDVYINSIHNYYYSQPSSVDESTPTTSAIVYPNPSGTMVFIEFQEPLASPITSVCITDISGNTIRQGITGSDILTYSNGVRIDASSLLSGSYFVRLVCGNETKSFKFVR